MLNDKPRAEYGDVNVLRPGASVFVRYPKMCRGQGLKERREANCGTTRRSARRQHRYDSARYHPELAPPAVEVRFCVWQDCRVGRNTTAHFLGDEACIVVQWVRFSTAWSIEVVSYGMIALTSEA